MPAHKHTYTKSDRQIVPTPLLSHTHTLSPHECRKENNFTVLHSGSFSSSSVGLPTLSDVLRL